MRIDSWAPLGAALVGAVFVVAAGMKGAAPFSFYRRFWSDSDWSHGRIRIAFRVPHGRGPVHSISVKGRQAVETEVGINHAAARHVSDRLIPRPGLPVLQALGTGAERDT